MAGHRHELPARLESDPGVVGNIGYTRGYHKSQGSTAVNVYAIAEGNQVADCHIFVSEDARERWVRVTRDPSITHFDNGEFEEDEKPATTGRIRV